MEKEKEVKNSDAKRLLSFAGNPVQELSLSDLSNTHLENYPDGTPVGGIHHVEFLLFLLEELKKQGIEFEVSEIFAANNKFRKMPGVTILPEVEERDGVGSLTSHILRRVFANINLKGQFCSEKGGYNICVSYTQIGISVGFGPMVYACHNQSICQADRIISNYTLRGTERLSSAYRDIKYYMHNVTEQIAQIPKIFDEDSAALERLKTEIMSPVDIRTFIGMLVEEHARSITPNPLHRAVNLTPLTSAQINNVVDALITKDSFKEQTAFSLYQACTQVIKPDAVPFENIAIQSCGVFSALKRFYDGRI